MTRTRRLRLLLEYDGTDFEGWQVQPRGRSVQGAVETALAKVTQEERRVTGAGRTDAGVHALGQVAHVDTASRLSPVELRRALNAVLPDDVAVRAVAVVAPDFHARFDAAAKRYAYLILNRAAPSPLLRRRSWHLRARLDLSAMRAGAALLVGTRDFAAFRGAPGGPPPHEATRRTLDRLEVLRAGDEVRIVAEAPSFLRYMVRNLVGTLVDLGLGRCDPGDLSALLASADRSRAGPTAPACGLCLERVSYPDSAGTGGT